MDEKQNIEIKARLASLVLARETAQRLSKTAPHKQHQLDTYFNCNSGRLKLREIDQGKSAQLIWYSRPDQIQAKTSRYRVVPVIESRDLKSALVQAWGVDQVIEKHREIHYYENVRIHLDQVSQLGLFLEFEAVIGPAADREASHHHLAVLLQEFGIRDADLVAVSYSDLLRGPQQGRLQ